MFFFFFFDLNYNLLSIALLIFGNDTPTTIFFFSLCAWWFLHKCFITISISFLILKFMFTFLIHPLLSSKFCFKITDKLHQIILPLYLVHILPLYLIHIPNVAFFFFSSSSIPPFKSVSSCNPMNFLKPISSHLTTRWTLLLPYWNSLFVLDHCCKLHITHCRS